MTIKNVATRSKETADDKGPVTLGASQVAVAEKLVAPLGMMDGSFTHHLMVGAFAYILSLPDYQPTGNRPLSVRDLKTVVAKNKAILLKALEAMDETLEFGE